MDLLEHHGKEILRRHGVRVPKGELAQNPIEASAASARLGQRCMVKAQIRQGGRGKAGLVKAVDSAAAAAQVAAEMFGVGSAVEVDALLIEERLSIASELYLAIRLDDVLGAPVVLASVAGGMAVEDQADKIVSHTIDVLDGLAMHHVVDLWKRAGLKGAQLAPAAAVTLKLWQAYCAVDAQLVEVNPLVVDEAGVLWAADAKISLDDNAIARHPELQAMFPTVSGTALENRARRLGVNTYLDLAEHGIATISSGASFGMLILDQITAAGGQPANFMDMGGNSSPLAREKIMDVVLYKAEQQSGIAAILIAFVLTSKPLHFTIDAIRNAFTKRPSPCPVFAWICAGQVATENLSIEQARRQLEEVGINTFAHLADAVAAAVNASKS